MGGKTATGDGATKLLIQQLKELRNRMAGNPKMQEMIDQQIKELSK